MLHDILVKELGHYDDAEGARIQLGGPRIAVPGGMASPVGMAVHKLTTNAAKHGALSVPHWRIVVDWDGTEAPGAPAPSRLAGGGRTADATSVAAKIRLKTPPARTYGAVQRANRL